MNEQAQRSDPLKNLITGFSIAPFNDCPSNNALPLDKENLGNCMKCSKIMEYKDLCKFCFLKANSSYRRRIFFGPEKISKFANSTCKLYLSKEALDYLLYRKLTIKFIEILDNKESSFSKLSIKINNNAIQAEDKVANITQYLCYSMNIIEVKEKMPIYNKDTLIYGELFVKLAEPTKLYPITQFNQLVTQIFDMQCIPYIALPMRVPFTLDLYKKPIRGPLCSHVEVTEFNEYIDKCTLCMADIDESYIDEYTITIIKALEQKLMMSQTPVIYILKNSTFILDGIKYSVQSGSVIEVNELYYEPQLMPQCYMPPMQMMYNPMPPNIQPRNILPNSSNTKKEMTKTNTKINLEVQQMCEISEKKLGVLQSNPRPLKISCIPGYDSYLDYKNGISNKRKKVENYDAISKCRMSDGLQNMAFEQPPKLEDTPSYIFHKSTLAIPSITTPINSGGKSEGIAMCPICNAREINYLIIDGKDKN